MVAALRDEGLIASDNVADAMNTVHRQDFVPGKPLEKVYETHTTLTPKIDADGRQTSVVPASHIQAIQLEQAGVEAGIHVTVGSWWVRARKCLLCLCGVCCGVLERGYLSLLLT
jgi:protein-L-isoaspartate O-methyltransferase